MFYAAVVIATAIPVTLGLLVVRRSGQQRIGWLLVAQGLSVGLLLGGSEFTGGSRVTLIFDQLTQGSWIFLFLWLVLIAYLLPDGHVLSRRWGLWVRSGLVGAVLFLIGAAGDRDTFAQEHNGAEPPLPWLPQPVSGLLGVVGLALVVLLFFGSGFAVRSRLQRSSGRTRLQLLWLVWGALAVPAGLLLLWADYFVLGGVEWLTNATLTGISIALPVTITVGILRYQLFDIRLVLSRTLTYGVLVLGVLTLYAGVLLAADWLGGNGRLGGLLAVAIVAVSVNPAHAWLIQRVERWVYGYRSQPGAALRLLADRAESADPGGVLEAVTDAVAQALRVPQVWVDTEGVDHAEGVERTPLVHRGERLGDLAVQVPAGRRLSPADRSLLQDLARYAALLVSSEQQAEEVRESRSRIVIGREEERRRLRRDLHDGVGPSLAAIVLTLNAAQARDSDAERNLLLDEAREHARESIAEVRRVVDDLRPPATDEVGLLAAIDQRAAALSGEVVIEVSGPEPMPALPAAVEVAAFRIASEAMANVVQHAGATRCRVDLYVNGQLELTVADNGNGPGERSDTAGSGVGWTSMRERAAELGGTCTMTRRPEGGLLVRAVLPLGLAEHDADVEGA
ncbi:MAG: sensor histidine kinase [Candidatus Nanopelagicales bacterium]